MFTKAKTSGSSAAHPAIVPVPPEADAMYTATGSAQTGLLRRTFGVYHPSRQASTNLLCRTRPARLLRSATALVAAAGISGTLAITSAGAASAAVTPVVTSEPLFDCYSGSIVADKPQILENGGTITWQPEVDYYTNGKWAFAAWGPQQTVPATSGGELQLYNQGFNARHYTYYMVWDWFYTAANGWVRMAARAERGGAPVNSYVCETS